MSGLSWKAQNKVNHEPEVAPHTLFTFSIMAPSEQRYESKKENETDVVYEKARGLSTETEEPLRIRALYDVSVLEVFVNDRTIISTRIYSAGTQCHEIRLFAKSMPAQEEVVNDEESTILRYVSIWDGLEAPGSEIESKV